MGCDFHGSCLDCRTTAYFGYGSYGTWDIPFMEREEDFLAKPEPELLKNKNVRKFVQEHEGHHYVFWSTDWAFREGDDLLVERGYKPPEVLVKGEKSFLFLDMEGRHGRPL